MNDCIAIWQIIMMNKGANMQPCSHMHIPPLMEIWCMQQQLFIYLYSGFTTMQTREQWYEKIHVKKERRTVEGQHHHCGAAQL